MELRADRHPSLDLTLDRLDHAVRRAGGDLEARGEIVDRHVVHAVDADLTVPVDAFHDASRLDEEGVTMGVVAGILVGDRLGEILGNVEEEGAPFGDVEELHAGADGKDGHVSAADVLGEHSVEVLAPDVHGADGRVGHPAVAAWVEVSPADHHDPVEEVEEPDNVILVGEGGHDDGNPTGGGDSVEIARGHERERGMLLAGCTVVGVDADEGLGCHEVSPEDRRIVDAFVRPNAGWSYVDPRISRMNLPPSAAPQSTDFFDV